MVYRITHDNNVVIPSYTGNFIYQFDLNQDNIDDFVISGSTWPGHLDHTGPSYIYDYETIIQALHDSAFIAYNAEGYSGPCTGDILGLNAAIDENLIWESDITLTIKLTENFIQCSWGEDPGDEENFFLGLRLQVNNSDHYGWLDIDGSANPLVKAYALNLTPNNSILAGQTE